LPSWRARGRCETSHEGTRCFGCPCPAGSVDESGYDFTTAFEYGLDLILDALEKRRDTA